MSVQLVHEYTTYTGIGLGLRDARFITLYYKITHNFSGECAIFVSRVVYLVNILKLRTELVKSRIKKHRNARFCTLQYFLTYGFDDTALKFMSMYMGSRKQTTIINGISSPLKQVTYGTAQGSILGPLIFILYVNDIFSSIDQDNSAFMYADDTLLIFEDENPAKVTDKAQKALQMVYEWCQANKLHINIDKTK